MDIATLTGACMVALGKYKAGLMGNDDGLIRAAPEGGRRKRRSVWHMPSGDEYAEEMKSKIADLKNIGSQWGGACTAAAFLGSSSATRSGRTWTSPAWICSTAGNTEKAAEGATGFGVRLLTTYLMNLAKQRRTDELLSEASNMARHAIRHRQRED